MIYLRLLMALHGKEKRQSLYEAQDAVDQKKEDLINRVEAMLNQKTEQNQLFTFKWTLV